MFQIARNYRQKINEKSLKYQKQSENRGVSPGEREKKLVAIICETDRF